jgi:nucleoside-diphosphate-sugar epimerase
VLITGGAGFIGAALAARLAEHDNTIILFDNLHRNAVARTRLLDDPRIALVKGDVLDADELLAAMEGAEYVVHMASIAGVDTVMRIPVRTMTVSLIGTYNALEAAAKTGTVRRFVDFSTSEVFGRFAYRVTEGDVTQLGAVGEARWTYAVSKLATEHLAHCYFKEHALPTAAIRPFNIYGPNQVGEGAVHHFILRALRGEPLQIHNDGSQIRSWCYIDDIVDGISLVLEQPNAVGNSFNIGNPRSTVTIHHLAKEIVRLAGSSSPIVHVPWDFPDVELRIPSIDKARDLLGFSPRVELEEGLSRTIDWYRRELSR